MIKAFLSTALPFLTLSHPSSAWTCLPLTMSWRWNASFFPFLLSCSASRALFDIFFSSAPLLFLSLHLLTLEKQLLSYAKKKKKKNCHYMPSHLYFSSSSPWLPPIPCGIFFVNDSTESCFVLMEPFHRLNIHTRAESSWLSCKHANMWK